MIAIDTFVHVSVMGRIQTLWKGGVYGSQGSPQKGGTLFGQFYTLKRQIFL